MTPLRCTLLTPAGAGPEVAAALGADGRIRVEVVRCASLDDALARLRGVEDAIALLDLALATDAPLPDAVALAALAPAALAVAWVGGPVAAERAARPGGAEVLVAGESGALLAHAVAALGGRARELRALRDRVERGEAFFRQSGEAMFVSAPDGRMLDANDAWLTLFGVSRPELPSFHGPTLFADLEDRPPALTLLARDGMVRDHEVILRNRAGEAIECRVTVTVRRSPDGAILDAQGIVRDLTAQRRLQREAERERGRTEQTLRESVATYRALFDAISDLVFILDTDDRLVNVNVAVLQATGYGREALIGATPVMLSDAERNDLAEIPNRLAAARRGEPQRFHWWARRRDGSVFPMEVVLTRGEYFGQEAAIAVARDVSDRLRAEESLRESEARFRLLFERNPHPMWVFDVATLGFLAVNDAAMVHYGYSRAEFLAMRITDIRPEAEVDALVATVRGRSGYVARDVWHHRKKSGDVITVEISSHDLVFDGRAARVILAIDVTERERTAAALRRSEARFSGIIALASEAIISMDAQNRVVLFNGGAERIFGYRAEEVLGRPLDLLLPERFREVHGGHMREFEGAPAPSRHMGERNEVFGRRRNGEEFPAEASISRLELEGEQLLTVVLRDVTERRRAEALLLEAYQRQEAFLDSLPDLAWMKDTEGRFLAVNEAFARDTGLPREALIGRTSEVLRLGAAAERYGAEDEAVMTTGRRVVVEETIVTPRGETWVETIKAPILDAEGRVTGMVGIARNVEERRRMEQELRATYDRLQQILSASPAVLFTLQLFADGSTRPSLISANVREMLGYDEEEALAPGWWRARVHPEDREAAAGWPDALRREGRVRQEYRFRHRDGRYRWLRDELALSGRGVDGALEVVGTRTDITERKEAELAVVRSRDYYHSLLDRLPTLVRRTDPDGVGDYFNRSWIEFTGLTAEELRAGGWAACVHPEDVEAYEAAAAAAFARREAYETEYRMRHRSGDYRWVLEVGRPLLAADGEFQGFIGGAIDLHNQRELEEQLRQVQKLEAVGRLAGGIAHDFNNLLTAIKGNTSLLLADLPASDPIREDIREIEAAADRAAGLTRQLLAFSRKQVLQPRVLDLNEVIGGIDRMLRRLIGEDVEMVAELAPVGTVRADRGQLEQVIVNLAINGRDAMPNGGRLVFRTRTLVVGERGPQPYVRPGRYVAFSVEDTGRGMDEATRLRIFEPFFTTKPVGEGTGLGLSTAFGIVKQSDGYIWAESEPGRGTTFTVLLPQEAAPVAATGQPAAGGTLLSGVETVLLVEDEALVRSTTRRILLRSGYTVLEAGDAGEAVRIAREYAPPIDVLLTDVVMPGQGGPELAREIVALRPGVRVIFMTGYAEDSIVSRGVLHPGTLLLEKPFSPERLARVVRQALEG